jgi:hypothetical protein
MFLAHDLETSRHLKRETMSNMEKIFREISGNLSKVKRQRNNCDSCKESD